MIWDITTEPMLYSLDVEAILGEREVSENQTLAYGLVFRRNHCLRDGYSLR